MTVAQRPRADTGGLLAVVAGPAGVTSTLAERVAATAPAVAIPAHARLAAPAGAFRRPLVALCGRAAGAQPLRGLQHSKNLRLHAHVVANGQRRPLTLAVDLAVAARAVGSHGEAWEALARVRARRADFRRHIRGVCHARSAAAIHFVPKAVVELDARVVGALAVLAKEALVARALVALRRVEVLGAAAPSPAGLRAARVETLSAGSAGEAGVAPALPVLALAVRAANHGPADHGRRQPGVLLPREAAQDVDLAAARERPGHELGTPGDQFVAGPRRRAELRNHFVHIHLRAVRRLVLGRGLTNGVVLCDVDVLAKSRVGLVVDRAKEVLRSHRRVLLDQEVQDLRARTVAGARGHRFQGQKILQEQYVARRSGGHLGGTGVGSGAARPDLEIGSCVQHALLHVHHRLRRRHARHVGRVVNRLRLTKHRINTHVLHLSHRLQRCALNVRKLRRVSPMALVRQVTDPNNHLARTTHHRSLRVAPLIGKLPTRRTGLHVQRGLCCRKQRPKARHASRLHHVVTHHRHRLVNNTDTTGRVQVRAQRYCGRAEKEMRLVRPHGFVCSRGSI